METKTWEKILERQKRTAKKIIKSFNDATLKFGKISQWVLTDAVPRQLEDVVELVERDFRNSSQCITPTLITQNSWWSVLANGDLILALKNEDGFFCFDCVFELDADIAREIQPTNNTEDTEEKLFAEYHNGDGAKSKVFRKIFDELDAGLISFEVDDSGRLQFYVESETGIVYHVVPHRKGVRVFVC